MSGSSNFHSFRDGWSVAVQDLFNIAHSILLQLPSSFFAIRLVSVHVLHPYASIDTTAAWKKLLTKCNENMINTKNIVKQKF